MERIKLNVNYQNFNKRRIVKESNLRYGKIFIYTDADPDG